MSKKDYTDPKTVQKIIEKCRNLQEEFNEEINLDFLEEAIDLLNEAIDNTIDDDLSQQRYFYEIDRLYILYPDIDKWLSGHRNDIQKEIKRQITFKNYSDPKTVQDTIEKCTLLQEKFNEEINLELLEEAINLLNDAIDNTTEDNPSQEKYIYERNRIYNRYPDVEKWLSGPRYDYQLDIKYIYNCLNENHERLDRNIIINYLSGFNRKREKDIQEFFNKYREIFMGQFDYALVEFEGKRYSQDFGEKLRLQNWLGIFLNSQEYPKWANDESFTFKNAPPLDEDCKIHLPVRLKINNKNPHKFPDQKANNGNCRCLMPINVYVWYWDGEPEDSRGYFEFSSQLIRKIASLDKLIQTEDVNNLDIKSFHFLIDYLYINNDVYEKIENSEGSIEPYSYIDSGDPIVIDKNQIPAANLDELRRLRGDREEKIFGTIEISQTSLVNLRLVFNNHPYSSSFEFEYWEDNPNSYVIHSQLPTSSFLEMFSGLHEDII